MCPSDRNFRTEAAATSDFKSAFDLLDADRDGKISREDLMAFYAGFSDYNNGIVASDDEIIGTMISVADANKDGFVEYEEFERVLGYRKRSGELMKDAFRVMDKDGDGRLSHQDLKAYMNSAGFAASDEDIAAMMRLGGADDKGGVTFEGWLRILAVV